MPQTITRRATLAGAGYLLSRGFASAATPANTLVVAQALDEMVSIDPAQAFEVPSDELITNVYDPLFGYVSSSGEPQQAIVTVWRKSDDGLSYSFDIRQGVKFHSGNPLTADDVVFSLQRALKLNFAPASDLGSFGLLQSNATTAIQKTGQYSFTLKLAKPYSSSLYLNGLGQIVCSVVDKQLVLSHETNGDLGNAWLKINSAGSGPFRLRNWTPLESYVLERVPGHWRGDAHLQNVIVRSVPEASTQRLLLERGDVDIARDLAPGDVAALEANPAIRIDKQLKGRLIYLAFNQKNPFLAKPQVAQALKYLIDYQGMQDTLLRNQYVVHQNAVPATFLAAVDDNPFKLDVAKARALLAEAGLPNGFEVTMDVRNAFPFKDMALAIQATFAQAGVKLTVIPADGGQLFSKYRARKHDIYIGGWTPDYADPEANVNGFINNPDNDAPNLSGLLAWRNGWANPKLMALDAQAVVEPDTAKRIGIYQEIQRELREQSPYVFAFQLVANTGLAQGVKGFDGGGAVSYVKFWPVSK